MPAKKKATAKRKTTAKKPAKKTAAKKRPAKKSAAKKPVAKKKVTKKSAAKKKVTKNKPVKKTAVKKQVSKKASTKKTTGKTVKKSMTTTKTPVKKTATKKKTVTKKTVAKKLVKKSVVKKAAPKKAVAKKAPAKKAEAKKAAAELPVKKAAPKRSGKTKLAVAEFSAINKADIKPFREVHDDDYMGSEMVQHFQAILLAYKKQLREKVDGTMHYMQDDSANLPDLNDRASLEEEFSLELRTRDRERKLIKKIDESLQLIDDGEYGYCEACGVEIGVRRLEARPTAVLCIDCKTIQEMKERQGG